MPKEVDFAVKVAEKFGVTPEEIRLRWSMFLHRCAMRVQEHYGVHGCEWPGCQRIHRIQAHYANGNAPLFLCARHHIATHRAGA